MPYFPNNIQGSKVAAAEVTTVETNPVADFFIFITLQAFARDVDSAISTSIEIGIMNGTKKTPIDCSPGSFAANISHNVFWPAVLLPGDKLYATFSTPSAGDHLEVIGHGFAYPAHLFYGMPGANQCD